MIPQHILVLYKVSTYEYYRCVPHACSPDPVALKRFEKTHAAHYRSLQDVERVLQKHGLRYEKMVRGKIDDYSDFDMVITVGGDGTFLEAARYVQDQVVLGVNSDTEWSIGRLCSFTADTLEEAMDEIVSGKRTFHVLNRLVLNVNDAPHGIHFLNDILIAHSNPASLSRYILQIGDACEEQRGSGIWIATATGSTSAIHSAGGTVLPSDSRQIQYMPRELYQGWNNGVYNLRGGILSPETRIFLTSLMAEGMIFIDGSHQRLAFGVSEKIMISQSEKPLRVF